MYGNCYATEPFCKAPDLLICDLLIERLYEIPVLHLLLSQLRSLFQVSWVPGFGLRRERKAYPAGWLITATFLPQYSTKTAVCLLQKSHSSTHYRTILEHECHEWTNPANRAEVHRKHSVDSHIRAIRDEDPGVRHVSGTEFINSGNRRFRVGHLQVNVQPRLPIPRDQAARCAAGPCAPGRRRRRPAACAPPCLAPCQDGRRSHPASNAA